MPGNPHVRFDEGRVGRHLGARPLSYSTVSASKRSLPHGSDPTDPRSRCSTVERCGKLKGIRRAASVKVILDTANLDEGG
jgi:hypothetical protein